MNDTVIHNNPNLGYPTLGNELLPMIIFNKNKAMAMSPLIRFELIADIVCLTRL